MYVPTATAGRRAESESKGWREPNNIPTAEEGAKQNNVDKSIKTAASVDMEEIHMQWIPQTVEGKGRMGKLEIVRREVSGCNNNVMREIEPNNCLDCYKRTLIIP